MCDPVSAAAAMMAAGAIQAKGAYDAGKAAEDMGNRNAGLAELQAKDAEARGNIDEQNQLTKTRAMIGAAVARYGASGVDSGTGTALDVETNTARMGALDAMTIRNNAAREAWGHRVDGWNSLAQGKIARAEGNNQAVGTLLASSAQAYGIYKMPMGKTPVKPA